MKQYLPYNVLMVIAVVMAGLTLFYNLVLRESFSVFVKYQMPAVPQPEQAEPVIVNAGGAADEGISGHSDERPQSEDVADEDAVVSVKFPIDINKATEAQLCFIPQVGTVTAQRIVQYREVLGGYSSLEQLKEIKGISDKTYENIAAYLIIAENE